MNDFDFVATRETIDEVIDGYNYLAKASKNPELNDLRLGHSRFKLFFRYSLRLATSRVSFGVTSIDPSKLAVGLNVKPSPNYFIIQGFCCPGETCFVHYYGQDGVWSQQSTEKGPNGQFDFVALQNTLSVLEAKVLLTAINRATQLLALETGKSDFPIFPDSGPLVIIKATNYVSSVNIQKSRDSPELREKYGDVIFSEPGKQSSVDYLLNLDSVGNKPSLCFEATTPNKVVPTRVTVNQKMYSLDFYRQKPIEGEESQIYLNPIFSFEACINVSDVLTKGKNRVRIESDATSSLPNLFKIAIFRKDAL